MRRISHTMKWRLAATALLILLTGGWLAWFRSSVPPPAAAVPALSVPVPLANLPLVDAMCRLPAFVMPATGSVRDFVRPPLLPKIMTASAVSAGAPQVRTLPRKIPPEPLLAAGGAGLEKPAQFIASDVMGEREMEEVQGMLRDFRTRMGENPVGSNAEIMRAVMGGNPVKAHLGPPPGQTLNETGELLDPWGMPWFFHQISAKGMEVRSAGPDLKLWSTDDLVSR